MKLKSFYKDNIYIITQTAHGANQNGRAFDFGFLGYGDKGFYAPANLTFKRKWSVDYNGGCEYWIDGVKNAYIQIVHATPTNTGNRKEGELVCTAKGDHYHLAINIDGVWYTYLDFCERDAELYFWQYGRKKSPHTDWSHYTDRQLKLINNAEMVKLQLPIQIQTTNTTDLNVREQPTTSSKIINKIPTSAAFSTDIVASGDDISGNKTWYGVLNGYISGAFVKEIPQVADCSAIEAQLNEANAKLDATIKKVEDFKNSINLTKETYGKL